MKKLKAAGGTFSDSSFGFTLIEVMIALVVLLIGMLGVIGMQYYSVTGNAASRELKIATNLGQELVERIKSTPYTNLVSGADPDNPATGPEISGGVTFTRALWVVPDCVSLTLPGDDNSCGANLAAGCAPAGDPDGASVVPVSAVRVRACWNDLKTGAPHSVTLDTVRWNENVIP
ncbi:MAG: prepilin-type N-terminal cleavage/methylation domain-containing protein [Nitrospirae bacterium]|nr:prepilin-type N-terminal cleavage/methylation domain-containing protein [Nitrospirota bacterium]